jgi:signal transduction histidine kinase
MTINMGNPPHFHWFLVASSGALRWFVGLVMQDWYEIPAFILTALLLPAFGRLYFRSRDTRTLLWFLAFFFAVVRILLLHPVGSWDLNPGNYPWRTATGESCGLLSSALFLGSLSPRWLEIGKLRVLYVIPYIGPMVIYAILAYGAFHGVQPRGPIFWIFPALAVVSFAVAFLWNVEKGDLPIPAGAGAVLLFGGLALWFCFHHNLYRPLVLAEAGNHLVAALLVLFIFRRFSSGTVISFLGLLAWSCPVLLSIPSIAASPSVSLNVIRLIVMSKIVTALGFILLVLENEIADNQAKGEQERRARLEMEAYTGLVLSRRRVEDFDRRAPEICRTIVENSRFSQAALVLLQPAGHYRLAGAAGLDQATEKALAAFAGRIPTEDFPPQAFSRPAVADSATLEWNLEPWLAPGDDLAHLGFSSALMVPMQGRELTEGALLLAGMRQNGPRHPLRKDDLLPLEMLTSRLQAVRSQTAMMEKLVDSEKFAGLGQLAGNVMQQLNNPLTVILGYASLLEETPQLREQERKGIEAILTEARHMRATLQSLSQFSRSPAGPRSAVSVPEMLADMERLHRAEFLKHSIEFRVKAAPGIPRVLCRAQQLRQAVLHCLNFAREAVECLEAGCERTVRLEASAEGGRVQIVVAHSGPGFQHPERAFDPYLAPIGGMDASGLGLSLCATILRDNDGRASAVNLGAQGAAILLDLQAA